MLLQLLKLVDAKNRVSDVNVSSSFLRVSKDELSLVKYNDMDTTGVFHGQRTSPTKKLGGGMCLRQWHT